MSWIEDESKQVSVRDVIPCSCNNVFYLQQINWVLPGIMYHLRNLVIFDNLMFSTMIDV